jgi:hypothetical protein
MYFKYVIVKSYYFLVIFTLFILLCLLWYVFNPFQYWWERREPGYTFIFTLCLFSLCPLSVSISASLLLPLSLSFIFLLRKTDHVLPQILLVMRISHFKKLYEIPTSSFFGTSYCLTITRYAYERIFYFEGYAHCLFCIQNSRGNKTRMNSETNIYVL